MSAWWIAGAVLLVAVGAARADILVWTDADGARHFTNRADAVPRDLTADVLVRDSAPEPQLVAATVEPVPAPPAAVVASDIARLDEAYRAGLTAGLTFAASDNGGASGGGGGGGGAASGGTIEINGPLAVANARSTDEGFGFYPYVGWGGYYPFVTTGFDRGRSRHQTLRMLLQDQFAIDRDGPVRLRALGPARRRPRPGAVPAARSAVPRAASTAASSTADRAPRPLRRTDGAIRACSSGTRSVLLVIDVQEGYRGHTVEHDRMVRAVRSWSMRPSSSSVPVLATEQYPKGIGHTAAGSRRGLPARRRR